MKDLKKVNLIMITSSASRKKSFHSIYCSRTIKDMDFIANKFFVSRPLPWMRICTTHPFISFIFSITFFLLWIVTTFLISSFVTQLWLCLTRFHTFLFSNGRPRTHCFPQLTIVGNKKNFSLTKTSSNTKARTTTTTKF